METPNSHPSAIVDAQMLMRMHALLQTTLTACGSADPGNVSQIVGDFRQRAQSLLGETLSLTLCSPLPLLSDTQYYLPPTLRDLHDRLVTHLASDGTNEHFTHSGLLLYGLHGTGKTDYARYLGWVLGDHVAAVSVDTSTLRNSENPGGALRSLYASLHSHALTTGKYVLVLLDEFDKFMSRNSATTQVTRQASGHSADMSTSTTQTQSHFVLDEVGSDLFDTIKTLVSGTGTAHRVFTIATTNHTDIPDALTREWRFLKHAFGTLFRVEEAIYTSRGHGPVYTDYAGILQEMLAIFQATHVRLCGQKANYLTALHGELQKVAQAQIKAAQKPSKVRSQWALGVNTDRVKGDLELLMNFFGIRLKEDSRLQSKFRVYGGERDTLDGASAASIKHLTPAVIAAAYKPVLSQWWDITQGVRTALRGLVFPWLNGQS